MDQLLFFLFYYLQLLIEKTFLIWKYSELATLQVFLISIRIIIIYGQFPAQTGKRNILASEATHFFFNLQFMSTLTVVEVGLVRLVLEASHVNLVRRNDLSMEWNVISFRTVPLLRIWYVSSINWPDFFQVTLGRGYPKMKMNSDKKDEAGTWTIRYGFSHKTSQYVGTYISRSIEPTSNLICLTKSLLTEVK